MYFFAGILAVAGLFFGKEGFFLACGALVALFLILLHLESLKKDEALRVGGKQAEVLASTVKQHAEELAGRRKMLSTTGPYGQTNSRRWEREKAKFAAQVYEPQLMGKSSILTNESVSKAIDDLIDKTKLPNQLSKKPVTELTPIEFEQACAAILEKAGWKATQTKASGDQGADIVAEKPGLKVVIQCKLYSKPVGNKAVQEVHAAKGIYRAKHAVVVSNQDFTTSAKEAAAALDVLLLHDYNLQHLYARLQGVVPPRVL